MTSYQSVLEFYVEKRKEFKISKIFACNTQDRISTYHARIIYEKQLVLEHFDTIYAVIKETLSQDPKDEKVIYDLFFKRRKNYNYANISWSTRNGSCTIIDDKTILSGIHDCIIYQYDHDHDVDKNRKNYDVFSMRFDDVIDIDGAIHLAKNVIMQTTPKLIFEFKWTLRIKRSLLVYVMSWTVKSEQFPDFLTVPNSDRMRNIYNENQLKTIILDHTFTRMIRDFIPKKEENCSLYRIKKVFFFEKMSCIEYFIYIINTYVQFTGGIIYYFKLRKTYYDVKTNRIYHRVMWYINSNTTPPAVIHKSTFLKREERKRQRE